MTVKLSVEGMSCDHCVGAVRNALSKEMGFDSFLAVVPFKRCRHVPAAVGAPSSMGTPS